MRGYPDMSAAIAFGAPHPSLGEVIVLCAVAIGGETLEPEPIIAFLKQKLAAYTIPRRILLCTEDELSFTGTQKIQTGKLIAKALARLRAEGAVIEGINYAKYLADTAS